MMGCAEFVTGRLATLTRSACLHDHAHAGAKGHLLDIARSGPSLLRSKALLVSSWALLAPPTATRSSRRTLSRCASRVDEIALDLPSLICALLESRSPTPRSAFAASPTPPPLPCAATSSRIPRTATARAARSDDRSPNASSLHSGTLRSMLARVLPGAPRAALAP
jgi:hypothetical protein